MSKKMDPRAVRCVAEYFLSDGLNHAQAIALNTAYRPHHMHVGAMLAWLEREAASVTVWTTHRGWLVDVAVESLTAQPLREIDGELHMALHRVMLAVLDRKGGGHEPVAAGG